MRNFSGFLISIFALILGGCAGSYIDDIEYQDANTHDRSPCVDGFGVTSQFEDYCQHDVVETKFTRLTIEYKQHNKDDPKSGFGEHFDQHQADQVLREIDKAQEHAGDVFVVFYVHGWHHNAKSNDDNFQKFDLMLARVRDQLDRGGHSSTKLIGIYAGWQGERVDSGLSSLLSIGDRAAAADIVATGNQNGIDCSKRSTLYNDLNYISRHIERNKASRLLVIGHSLGGRILSTAFMCDLRDSNTARPLNEQSTIVTINAAVDAGLYEPLFAETPTPSDPRKPYWINLTSRNDIYTNEVFTLASRVGLIKPLSQTKESSRNIAIGHYEPYITHTLDLVYLQLDPCGFKEGQFVCGTDAPKNKQVAGAWCDSSTGKLEEVVPCRIWSLPPSLPQKDQFGNIYQLNEPDFVAKERGYTFTSTPNDQTSWFRQSAKSSFPIVFRERLVGQPKNTAVRFSVDQSKGLRPQHVDAQVYLANFLPGPAHKTIPMNGLMWNIRTTDNVIDYAGKQGEYFDTGKHSAYVSSYIFKLLTELVIAPLSP